MRIRHRAGKIKAQLIRNTKISCRGNPAKTTGFHAEIESAFLWKLFQRKGNMALAGYRIDFAGILISEKLLLKLIFSADIFRSDIQ